MREGIFYVMEENTLTDERTEREKNPYSTKKEKKGSFHNVEHRSCEYENVFISNIKDAHIKITVLFVISIDVYTVSVPVSF